MSAPPAMAVRALLALPDVREDFERRTRGVTVPDWLDAPAPPDDPQECADPHALLEVTDDEGNVLELVPARPCPALRCKHHLGRVGERAGYTCDLDVAQLPEEMRTLDLVGRVLGVNDARAAQLQTSGMQKIEALPEDELRKLGVRRR